MQSNTHLVITSISDQDNAVLKQYALEAQKNNVPFIVIGDAKSPADFFLEGCDFYSLARQKTLYSSLSDIIPEKHYARKNLGYLIAIKGGADVIIETDDDNYPLDTFWYERKKTVTADLLEGKGWVNTYKYFTDVTIWPRGFALERLHDSLPSPVKKDTVLCPIQQGLADDNPDVDAIYRLTLPLPVTFNKRDSIAIGNNTYCPFNSQNTTWFKEAFPLLYLPSYCSFRMTDIWRSFIAQRVAWACGWHILFHNATVYQDRNEHNLMQDFADEIVGYSNNLKIMENLHRLSLPKGVGNIPDNMMRCYSQLIKMQLIDEQEMSLLTAWFHDLG